MHVPMPRPVVAEPARGLAIQACDCASFSAMDDARPVASSSTTHIARSVDGISEHAVRVPPAVASLGISGCLLPQE
ncbi:hypothetical protein, partial [Escherichia coli]|uniref:hypothetical protein n=1 Tax=Escherichia coli TaxID=562 RepID=UPI001FA7244B